MPDLIAQGERPADRWRRELTAGQTVVIGRAGEGWEVPWDRWVSRRHAELTWRDGKLRVRQLPEARNPIFFRGKEAAAFDLRAGESFVIGATTFTLDAGARTPSPDGRPVLQMRSVSAEELHQIPFRDAPHRLDVLSRVPNVVGSAADDAELFIQLVNLLLAGIPRADVIGLVALEREEGGAPSVRVLHWDQRRAGGGEFRPSRRLVREAVGTRRETVLHVWAGSPEEAPGGPFTLSGDFDWAFCTPIGGEESRGWGIYVAGRFPAGEAATLLAPWDRNELGDDLKFAELAAAILGSLRQVRKLQRDQAVLSRFFSPAVQRVLSAADPEQALRPRETEVTVLFCDLRGFSRKVEAAAEDLPGVLERVSKALGVMTQQILDHRGVVADFLGDAALGFWGWPLAEPDMTRQACLAALGVRTYYEALARRRDHPLAEFRVGIGIATGRAVAGRIGTREQGKVTVFGPVVNLASRLEGMTKILHVPILIDEPTARAVRGQMPPQAGRCRRLALVRPYGLQTPLMVSELLPPADQYPALA
ncbi:MAG TPA: adenylate/guanylate cyclase domain-containing protein, partial [Gemmataceae bacterium]